MMSTRRIALLVGAVFVIVTSLLGVVLAQNDAESDNGGLTEEVAANFVERFDAFFNTPDFDIVDEIFAEDFQSHLPLAPQLDRQGFKDYVASFYVPFPDIKQTTNKVLISGDHLILHVTYTGTSEGEFFGAPPTGEEWVMNGIGIFQFEDGMAVENWAVIDIGELFIQTGVVPMGGETEATGGLTAEIAADFVPRFDAVINEDTALARDLFHEAFTAHLPFAQQMDREGWIAYADMFKASFPDIQQTTNFMFHSGDKLVIHVTYNATFSGQPFFGAEPTGDPIVMNGIGIFRFEMVSQSRTSPCWTSASCSLKLASSHRPRRQSNGLNSSGRVGICGVIPTHVRLEKRRIDALALSAVLIDTVPRKLWRYCGAVRVNLRHGVARW